MGFINIGFGNIVNSDKIITIILPDSAPAKRIIGTHKESGRLIDATQGRKTRAVIIVEGDEVILSALLPETIALRYEGKDKICKENL